jgi:hypothetical protein
MASRIHDVNIYRWIVPFPIEGACDPKDAWAGIPSLLEGVSSSENYVVTGFHTVPGTMEGLFSQSQHNYKSRTSIDPSLCL